MPIAHWLLPNVVSNSDSSMVLYIPSSYSHLLGPLGPPRKPLVGPPTALRPPPMRRGVGQGTVNGMGPGIR